MCMGFPTLQQPHTNQQTNHPTVPFLFVGCRQWEVLNLNSEGTSLKKKKKNQKVQTNLSLLFVGLRPCSYKQLSRKVSGRLGSVERQHGSEAVSIRVRHLSRQFHATPTLRLVVRHIFT